MKYSRLSLKTLLISSVLFIPVIVNAKVTEFELENGLKLLIKEDHRAPIVVTQVWYKVGGSYEHDGITGISHALEHLMVNFLELFLRMVEVIMLLLVQTILHIFKH